MSRTIPTMVDGLGALVGYLLALPAITVAANVTVNGTATRAVFGEEIPREVAESFGEGGGKAVLVKRVGSGVGFGTARSYLPVEEFRVDVWNTGETYLEAGKVRLVTYAGLRYLERVTVDGVMLKSAIRVAGPRSFTDPETKWPVILETWDIAAATELAA